MIDAFPAAYRRHLLRGQRAKLGLQRVDGADDGDDAALADDWLALLHAGHVDFTLAWRRLADAAGGDDAPLRALFVRTPRPLPDAWLARWRERCAREDEGASPGVGAKAARAERMRRVNPGSSRATTASRKRSPPPRRRRPRPVRAPARRAAPPVRGDAPSNASYAEPAAADVTAGYRTFCGTPDAGADLAPLSRSERRVGECGVVSRLRLAARVVADRIVARRRRQGGHAADRTGVAAGCGSTSPGASSSSPRAAGSTARGRTGGHPDGSRRHRAAPLRRIVRRRWRADGDLVRGAQRRHRAPRDAAVLAIRRDARCLGRRGHRRCGPVLRRGRDLVPGRRHSGSPLGCRAGRSGHRQRPQQAALDAAVRKRLFRAQLAQHRACPPRRFDALVSHSVAWPGPGRRRAP